MKILYLYQHFVLPEKSGITRTYEFARRLCSMGHEVQLIASDETFSNEKKKYYSTEHSGIKIHWLPIPYHNRLSFFKRVIAFLQYMIGAFRHGKLLDYDLVYVSSPPLTTTLPGIFLSRYKKVPLVLEVRDLWPDLPIIFRALRDPLSIRLAKWMELSAYRHANHVVALSPGIQRAVITRGVAPSNTSLIPNSCDIESFSAADLQALSLPEGISTKDQILLYPGTLGIANGVTYIVQLAKELRDSHPHIKFLVVGDGKEKELVYNLALKLGVLDRNFFMKDPVPKVEIPALFKRSTLVFNVLVNHRALWNSSPNKFFDALAASKPVAVNFEGWIAELIRKSDIGIVLSPTNTLKAAQQIVEALSRPLWVEKAGKQAFELGKREFHRDKLCSILNSKLENLINPSKTAENNPEPKRFAS